MTLQQLEYALELRKTASFSRTAQSMGISQPGVSLQIKKLEEALDLMLFERSSRDVKPTEDGELFLAQAELLLTQARQLEELAET